MLCNKINFQRSLTILSQKFMTIICAITTYHSGFDLKMFHDKPNFTGCIHITIIYEYNYFRPKCLGS